MKTKWEYCRLEVLDNKEKLTYSNALFMIPDGETRYNVNIPKTICDLGIEGWELFSHSKIIYDDMTEEIFYFKRPVEEEIPVYKDGVKLEKSRMYNLKEGI